MAKDKKTKKSIFRKIFIIILSVFISELCIFAFSLSFATNKLVEEVTYIRLEDYLKTAQLLEDPSGMLAQPPGHYIECVIIELAENFNDSDFRYSSGVANLLSEEQLQEIFKDCEQKASILEYEKGYYNGPTGKVYYSFAQTVYNTVIIAVSSEDYLNDSIMDMLVILVVLFIVIFLIAAFVTLLWAKLLVKRINKLANFVTEMPSNDYKEVFIDDGNDELHQLSIDIEGMRQTIVKDEATKQAMLQNVSHDLKTPIAVIRSYTEAIEDGVADESATTIIIEQCLKLEKKVKNFIDFNRLEHLSENLVNEDVKIKEIIEKIILSLKHLLTVDVILDLDDTVFSGRYENYYTVVENLIENAIRYAVKTIKITLKDGVLSVYNDGKPIDEKFVLEGFKPYEKGSEGKFGLGMSIVCRTLEIFGMRLEVKNESVGVTFTIKAK